MVQPGWTLGPKYPCIHWILSPNMNFLGPRRMQVLENFQQFCHRFGREGIAYENPTWPEVNVGPVWASLQSTTTKRAPTLVKTRRDKEQGERGRKRREKDRRWREEKRAEASRQQTYCRGPRQAHRWFWLGTVPGMARPARRKATKEREDEHTTRRTERNRRKRTRRKEPGSACLTAAWLALSALSTLPSFCLLYTRRGLSLLAPPVDVPLCPSDWLVSSRNKRRRGQWVPCQRLRPRLLWPVRTASKHHLRLPESPNSRRVRASSSACRSYRVVSRHRSTGADCTDFSWPGKLPITIIVDHIARFRWLWELLYFPSWLPSTTCLITLREYLRSQTDQLRYLLIFWFQYVSTQLMFDS